MGKSIAKMLAVAAAVLPALLFATSREAEELPSIALTETGLTVQTADAFKPLFSEEQQPAAVSRAARFRASSAVTDIAGDWVHSYLSMTTTGFDGGAAVKIEHVAGSDNEVTITNFWLDQTPATVVSATFDASTGKLLIPSQQLLTDPDYGPVDLAKLVVTATGAMPDRDAMLEGTVNEDGSISIDTYWGLFVNSGEYKDRFLVASYNTVFKRANGTMSYSLDTSSGVRQTRTYAVRVEQKSSNVISVENFFNRGIGIDMLLNRDMTATIESQVVWQNTAGYWNTIGNVTLSAEGKLTGYSSNFNTLAATDKRTISWKNWSLLTTGYFVGCLYTGTLKTDFDLSYPTLSVSEFTGSGTEEDPYSITTLDELILLSDRVNANSDMSYIPEGTNIPVARMYDGKYFRLDADIDMTGYRFTPIANDRYHMFSGTFDGNGHTLKGLTVSSGSKGFAGLFGFTDVVSVIKNLTITDADITTESYYAAPVVAWSLGRVENCHTVNAKVYSEFDVAAGVGGIVTDMYDCSSTGANITALGGHGGGVAGEVEHAMARCRAVGATIVTAGPNSGSSPAGGVVGFVNKATVEDCYFSGLLDAQSQHAPQSVGGITGTLNYGILRNCFVAGRIAGYSNDAVTGGIVGTLAGVMEDCYSAGRVDCPSGRRTGTLAGYVVYSQPAAGGEIIQAEVRRCYSSADLTAETFQYDAENCVREAFGEIYSGASPVIENVYTDRQVVDFGSKLYGATTADLTSANGPAGFSADVWTFTEGYYPRLKSTADTEEAKMSATALLLDPTSSYSKVQNDAKLNLMGATKAGFYISGSDTLCAKGHYAELVNGTVSLALESGSDTLFIENGTNRWYHILSIMPSAIFEGSGTETDPYLVKTKDDLILLSRMTREKKQTFTGTYFLMTNDIDIEYDETFMGIGGNYSGSDAIVYFEGIFDGGGHAVHRMKMRRTAFTVEPSAGGLATLNTSGCNMYSGFIGRLAAGAVVRNLTIAADCDLVLDAYSGALVGYNYGTVENCRNYADVLAYRSNVGGIVGYSLAGAVVRDCYNAGNITSGNVSVGGIVGSNYGFVENCANAGNVTVRVLSTNFKVTTSNNAGGIAGSSSGDYRNVMNTGSISVGNSKSGGLVGSLGKVTSGNGTNSIAGGVNYGMVSSPNLNLIGGVAGEGGTAGLSSGVYYDAQLLPCGAVGASDMAGVSGVATSVLISGNALEGLDSEVWDFKAGQYPVLKKFADEPALAAARRMILNLPEGTDVSDVTADGSLAADVVWTLTGDDTGFAVAGQVLKAPVAPAAVINDTLTAAIDNVKKLIPLKANPAVPLTGDGTAESPYIVASAADWNALASYMASTGMTLAEKYVKVAADFSFEGVEFQPISSVSIYFQGDFDGAGHTISGIDIAPAAAYGGVFPVIGDNGRVANLTLSGKVTSKVANTGGFAGKVYGTIENCRNLLDVTSTMAQVAGFAALACEGSLFDRCVNAGTITGSAGNIAGIAAQTEKGVTFTACGNEGVISNAAKGNYTAGIAGTALASTFTDCYNTGEFRFADAANTSNVGGLIGLANGTTATKDIPFEISGCCNEASITAKGILGGIIGSVGGSSVGLAILHVSGCTNIADITSISTSATSNNPTGGIMAFYSAGAVIKDCHNSGYVSAAKNVNVGGIAGQAKTAPTAAYPASLTGCSNSGAILASGNQGAGIVGNAGAYTSITDCYNTGTVEGGHQLGGIVGVLGANTTLTDCWNTGSVITSLNRAGGIAGITTISTTVNGCWNAGAVTTTSTTKGTTAASSGYAIGGIAGTGPAVFTGCYNLGTITGASQVGGIAGTAVKARTQFKSCYNAGRIVADADTCGAIVGVNIANSKVWADGNACEDTWFVSDLVSSDLPVVGTGVTMAELASKDMGDGWYSADDWSLPVNAKFAGHDAADVHAAVVVPAAGDTYDEITAGFKVGVPDGVEWKSSSTAVTFDGNDAKVAPYQGKVTLTATKGDFSKRVDLGFNVTSSGLDKILSAKEVERTTYYNLSGVQVPQPAEADGQLYILHIRYTDGTSETLKFLNR